MVGIRSAVRLHGGVRERAVSKAGFAWLWPFFKPHLGLIAKAVSLAAIVSALQMVLPIFTQIIVDRVVVEQDKSLLTLLIFGMLGVLLFMTAATLVQRRICKLLISDHPVFI